MNSLEDSKLEQGLARRYRYTASFLILLLFAFNLTNIFGWALGIDWIKHPIPGEPSGMTSGATVSFFLSALALWLAKSRAQPTSSRASSFAAQPTSSRASSFAAQPTSSPGRLRRSAALLLSLIVFLAGLSTFVEHVFHFYWELSYPLWKSEHAYPLSFPGPMFPDVSSGMAILGLCLFGFASGKARLSYLSKILMILVMLPNIMILCSYALGHANICAYFGCIKLSPVTSATFVLTGFALLLSEPETGITQAFLRKTVGARLLRRCFLGLLALAPLLPLRLALIKFGESTNPPLLDEALANGITGVLALAVIGGAVAWCLKKIDLIESEKEVVLEQLDHTINSIAGNQHPYKKVCLQCAREFADEFSDKCPDDGSDLSRIVDYLAPGSLFSEYYEIVGPLGEGGLSKVFLAKHKSSGKNVALKLLHSHLLSDTNYVQRFRREASALSKLCHPNLLAAEDFRISPDGIPFIIMDYLEGESLQQKLKREQLLSWQETVYIYSQVCQGLSHAHAKGIIHRDLKPGNIMLLPADGNGKLVAKVVDFGLAKAEQGDSIGRLTQTGDVFGSPMYMAPEQCQGLAADRRSDVYASGCILFECLNGTPPFVGRNVMDTLALHLTAAVPQLSPELNVPPWLVTVVQKALKKNADERQQSIDELAELLRMGAES